MNPTTALAPARTALEATARRTADLIRSLPDLNRPLANSDWTVRQAAAHLVSLSGIYTDIAGGMPSPIESMTRSALAGENARRAGDITEGDPGKLAGLVTEAVAVLLETSEGRSAGAPVVFHSGLPLDLARLLCIALGEHVLHGYDIAATVGAPWPVDPLHARLVLFGNGPCYPRWVDPETAGTLTMRYAVELDGGDALHLHFTGGACRLEDERGSEGAGCTISADPVAFLLLTTGRLPLAEAVALNLHRTERARPDAASRFLNLFAFP